MSQCATVFGASAPDRLSRLIQKRVFGDRVKIPLEVRLWGGRTYRFGAGEPAVKILVKDRKGLSALRRLNELRICEAYDDLPRVRDLPERLDRAATTALPGREPGFPGLQVAPSL